MTFASASALADQRRRLTALGVHLGVKLVLVPCEECDHGWLRGEEPKKCDVCEGTGLVYAVSSLRDEPKKSTIDFELLYARAPLVLKQMWNYPRQVYNEKNFRNLALDDAHAFRILSDLENHNLIVKVNGGWKWPDAWPKEDR